jgi:hypothetical protein
MRRRVGTNVSIIHNSIPGFEGSYAASSEVPATVAGTSKTVSRVAMVARFA